MHHRFSALDGMRGIAAITVVLFHLQPWVGAGFFARGYLSVDLFFILSGFVLEFAYGRKLVSGMSAADFLRARVRRLGPTLWIAAFMGFLCGLAILSLTDALNAKGFAAVAILAVQNAFLIPRMGHGIGDAFPLNCAMWSLFAELAVNIAFAICARILNTRVLVGIVVTGWCLVAFEAFRHGSADFGVNQADIFLGVGRAIPSFAMGVLLFRWLDSGSLSRLPSVNPLIVFGLWVVLSTEPAMKTPLFDMIQIVLIAPAIVALLACYRGSVPGWATLAGAISYPLYAIHLTILWPATTAYPHASLWLAAGLAAVAIGAAYVIAQWIEPAFRRVLERGVFPTSVPSRSV